MNRPVACLAANAGDDREPVGSRLVRNTIFTFLLGACLQAGVWAGGVSASPDSDAGKVTILARREAGEEEVIRRRSEWFFASRRPGSGGEMRLRRRDAVEELRAAVRMQAEMGADPFCVKVVMPTSKLRSDRKSRRKVIRAPLRKGSTKM